MAYKLNMTMNTKAENIELPKLSVKTQTFATLAAVCAAIVLPQILHTFGVFFGVGSALGEILLPMHLPVLLVGLLAGTYAGFATGLLAPIISFALTGMPALVMLPFIIVELSVYGLLAGLLRNHKMPVIGKVFLAQVVGRIARAAVVLFAVYVLGSTKISVTAAYMNIKTGMYGIILQWMLIPVITYLVGKASRHDGKRV